MSRKGSGKGKKGSAKSPKVQIKELTEQNATLNEELISLKNQHEELRNKMDCTVRKILEGVSRKDFNIKEATDPLDITTDCLLNMVGKMIIKKKIMDMSVEARVEQLETRVTQMTIDIAKYSKKTLAYENGLQDLLNSHNMEDVRDRVYQLQLIAGQEYHAFEAEDSFCQQRSTPTTNGFDSPVIATETIKRNFSPVPRPESAAQRIREDATKLNLTPPSKRFPGDTDIRNMHRDLRLLVMKELSLEKASGADWRMLAKRISIPEATIDYWRSLRLDCPMGRVMAEWGETGSEGGSSVRMLHRHLVSPQMRCTLLGKRIADFYEVD